MATHRTTRARGRLHRIANTLVAMLLVATSLTAAAPASAAPADRAPRARTVSTSLAATVPITGTATPYALSVWATADTVSVTLLGGERGASELEQQHSYSVDASALRCNKRMSRCTLDTRTALGSIGRVRLSFRSQGRASTSVFRCESTNRVLLRTKIRRGTVRARVRLATRTGYFGTIRTGRGEHSIARSFDASVYQRTDLGRDCDFDAGPATCSGPDMFLSSYWFEEGQSFYASIDRSPYVSISADGDSGVEGVQLDHRLTASPSPRFLRDTGGADPLSTVAVDLAALGPDVSGTARFVATGDLTVGDPYDGCVDRRRLGTLEIDATLQWHGFGVSTLADNNASAASTVRT